MMRERKPRAMAPWALTADLARMEQELARLLEDPFVRPLERARFGLGWPRFFRPWQAMAPRQPAIELSEHDKDVVVRAELPGIKKDDLEISLVDHLLTIRGEKKSREEAGDQEHVYSERYIGVVERMIEIPCEVKVDKARATLTDGILEVRLPKTEETKRKTITVRVD